MSTKSKINVEKFIDVARKFNLCRENSLSIKGPSDSCWSSISKELEHSINAKYAYTIIKTNRYGVADKLFLNRAAKIQNNDDDNRKSYLNNDDQENNDSSSSEFSEINDETLNFNITLSPNEWESLYDGQPHIYKRSDSKSDSRAFYSLKPFHWTTVIHDHFFEQTKLPCSVIYKYAKIYPNGQQFLIIHGQCSTCNSILKGVLNNCPNEGTRVVIRCTITGNFKNCRSHKKRKVIGEKKEQIINKLRSQNLSAAYFQRTEAKRIMEYGDLEPSHIPSLNALRIIKHKSIKKDAIHENPLVSMSLLKGTPPYNNIIRDIGYDKFFVHYWTTSEVNNYRNYTLNSEFPSISIDATGSIVKKINLFSGRQTHNVFLYQIAICDRNNNKQFAVAHMLSEKHDNNSIGYWLTEWLRVVKVPPKLVITDQSLALMHAIVKSFTQFSNLNTYLSVCSKLIMKEPGADIPTCMIRNDFNHVMHLISSWPELKNCTYRIKNFYMRSIGLLVISTSIEEIKYILKLIFTVALNETDGVNSDQESTECENAKCYLKQKIASHTVDINTEYEQDKDCLHEVETDDYECDVTKLTVFDVIRDIYESCEESSKLLFNTTGVHDNMQYSPKLAKKLLTFCKLIPCWSAVMVPIFGYGDKTESSASSESLFKDLKSIVFKHKTLPLRLDDFFVTHTNSIIGQMNLIAKTTVVSSNQCTDDLHPKITELYTGISNDEIDDERVENWKGLGQQKLPKKKSSYVDKDPSILHYNDKIHSKSSVIGILKNGSISELKSIRLNNENVTVVNTCAFDSFSQIWFCAYVDSNVYSKYVIENSKNKFMELVARAIHDGVNFQTYRRRASILKEIFDEKKLKSKLDGLIVVDSACTTQFMIGKLIDGCPSFIATVKCTNCLTTFSKEESYTMANLPTDNLLFLNDVLNSYNSLYSICQNCGHDVTKTIRYKDHIVVEPLMPLTEQRKIKKHLDLSVRLKDIPKIVTVQDENYYLRGLINFIPPIMTTVNSIGHYVAYCYREGNNTWEKYDDFQQGVKIVRPTTEVQNCQQLLYTK